MMSRGFAVLAFVAVLFITSQFTGVHAESHFILDGKVRSINSPGEGCCGKVLHFFKRLAKRYARTKLRLVADQLCILTEADGKWGCQQSEGSDRQAAMVVVEDQKGVLLSGVLKRSGKQKATDTTLLNIQPGAHVKADCGRWRCTFTHTGVCHVHQLRLSMGGLVIGPLEDGDQAVILIETRLLDREPSNLAVTVSMVRNNGVPVYRFVGQGLLALSPSGTTANRELDAPAIAVTLERKPLGLETKLTFVGKGKTLPPGTEALLINGVEGTQLTKRSVRPEAAIRWSGCGAVQATVSLAPEWVVLMRAKAQNVRVPRSQIKAIVFTFQDGRISGRTSRQAVARIKEFDRPFVVVQSMAQDNSGVKAAAERLIHGTVILQRVCVDVITQMRTFAKANGLAPSQILYEGDDEAVEMTNYAMGTM